MADFIITPNMNLPNPVPTVAPGPAWAQYISSCFDDIDQHDHSVGKGVRITPNGMNISSDLSFNDNNAIVLRSVRFLSQSGTLSDPTDIGCLYETGVDLWYNDGAGNQIRITQGGTVTGATGTITGLPSGTASASFVAGTFVFQSATSVGANIDGASFILRNNTVNSKGLTLSPPNAMPSDYTITLPFLPAVKGIVTLDSSGTENVEPAVSPVPAVITTDTSGNLGTQPLQWDVTVGVGGTYSTIGAAITAATTDQTILILKGTYTENVTVNKRLFIQGQGYGTQINGTLTFASGSSDAVMQDFRVLNNITINSGVSEVSLITFWLAAGQTIIDNGSGSFFQGMQE